MLSVDPKLQLFGFSLNLHENNVMCIYLGGKMIG